MKKLLSPPRVLIVSCHVAWW